MSTPSSNTFQQNRRYGVVHYERNPPRVSDLGKRRVVVHVVLGVADGLGVDEASVVIDGLGDLARV